MYLRGIFIARFGMALHFFYYSMLETSIDSFLAGKKLLRSFRTCFGILEKIELSVEQVADRTDLFIEEIEKL